MIHPINGQLDIAVARSTYTRTKPAAIILLVRNEAFVRRIQQLQLILLSELVTKCVVDTARAKEQLHRD